MALVKELQAETQRSRLEAWRRVASRLQRAGVGTAVMSSSGIGSHAPLVAPWFCGGSVCVVEGAKLRGSLDFLWWWLLRGFAGLELLAMEASSPMG
ncbi:hypothetical protein FCV25MIE_30831 [Fagus crenata]